MAKRIFGEVVAECISADPASPAKALSWSSWRRDFVGLTGWLKIYESEKKSPGRPFLYFYGGEESEKDWCLKTWYGEWIIQGDQLFFRTRNTRYVFRIIERGEA